MLDLQTVLQFLSIAALAGIMWQSITSLRRDLDKIEKEVVDFRELKSDIKVVKTELQAINVTLSRILQNRIDKDEI